MPIRSEMVRPFAKYEGLGNDFIVVDAAAWSLEDLSNERVQALCARHTGIGADGVLWVGPPRGQDHDARMVVFNADGSRPEMCGNGARCVGAFLHARGDLPVGATLRIETDAGVRDLSVLSRKGAHVGTGSSGARAEPDGALDLVVEVDAGPVTVAPERMTVNVGGQALGLFVVDVGNPHAVLFERGAEGCDPEAVVRAVVGRRDVFPSGANVELVEVRTSVGRHGGLALGVRVHERGVGWTQACGTGACAVAAAAVVSALHPAAREGSAIEVHFGGGVLEVTVVRTASGLRARLRGPARQVFQGTVALPQGTG